MAKIKFPENLEEGGIATVLRGFATQIQKLTLPRLNVVQKIGSDIGLVIITTQYYDNMVKNKQRNNDAIKAIISSSLTDKEKIIEISKLI